MTDLRSFARVKVLSGAESGASGDCKVRICKGAKGQREIDNGEQGPRIQTLQHTVIIDHALHVIPADYKSDEFDVGDMKRDFRVSGSPAHEGYGIEPGLHHPGPYNYFAHGTAAYYWRTAVYPFDRHDLFEYDPDLYWIVRAFWNNPNADCPVSL